MGMVLEAVEHGQIVEQLSDIRVLGPERLFNNGVTAFVYWLSLGVTDLALVQVGQVVAH